MVEEKRPIQSWLTDPEISPLTTKIAVSASLSEQDRRRTVPGLTLTRSSVRPVRSSIEPTESESSSGQLPKTREIDTEIQSLHTKIVAPLCLVAGDEQQGRDSPESLSHELKDCLLQAKTVASQILEEWLKTLAQTTRSTRNQVVEVQHELRRFRNQLSHTTTDEKIRERLGQHISWFQDRLTDFAVASWENPISFLDLDLKLGKGLHGLEKYSSPPEPEYLPDLNTPSAIIKLSRGSSCIVETGSKSEQVPISSHDASKTELHVCLSQARATTKQILEDWRAPISKVLQSANERVSLIAERLKDIKRRRHLLLSVNDTDRHISSYTLWWLATARDMSLLEVQFRELAIPEHWHDLGSVLFHLKKYQDNADEEVENFLCPPTILIVNQTLQPGTYIIQSNGREPALVSRRECPSVTSDTSSSSVPLDAPLAADPPVILGRKEGHREGYVKRTLSRLFNAKRRTSRDHKVQTVSV